MAKTLFAIVVSMLLAGGAARADSGESSEPGKDFRPGVIPLFGKTLCLSQAPADAVCDWRLGQPAPTDDERDTFLFFGKRWCTADALGPCDFRLPPAHNKGKVIQLFGMNWCFGDASPGSACDVRFPAVPEDGAQARM